MSGSAPFVQCFQRRKCTAPFFLSRRRRSFITFCKNRIQRAGTLQPLIFFFSLAIIFITFLHLNILRVTYTIPNPHEQCGDAVGERVLGENRAQRRECMRREVYGMFCDASRKSSCNLLGSIAKWIYSYFSFAFVRERATEPMNAWYTSSIECVWCTHTHTVYESKAK